jgi:hypothetical protein
LVDGMTDRATMRRKSDSVAVGAIGMLILSLLPVPDVSENVAPGQSPEAAVNEQWNLSGLLLTPDTWRSSQSCTLGSLW